MIYMPDAYMHIEMHKARIWMLAQRADIMGKDISDDRRAKELNAVYHYYAKQQYRIEEDCARRYFEALKIAQELKDYE